MSRILLRGLLMVVSIGITLALVEAFMRILDRPKTPISGWRAVGVNPSELNQLGFRGRPISYSVDDFVIVLAGDSQVEAKACAFDWMPERRLESHLNSNGARVRVFSVAASGYGQDQELLALREYFKQYRADLVLLWETPINDVWNNLFPTSWPADGTSKPTFWLQNGQLRGPSEEIGQPVRETPRLKLALAWRKNVRWWSRDREWERTYPPAYAARAEYSGPVLDDWQQWWPNNERAIREENLATEKAHLAMLLTPRSQRMQYALDLTNKLLREIERLTATRGGRLTAFTVDINLSDAEKHRPGVHKLNGKYYETSQEQFALNINSLNEGISFHRISLSFPDWKAGPEDPHLNQLATDQAMINLAERLRSLSLITARDRGSIGKEK